MTRAEVSRRRFVTGSVALAGMATFGPSMGALAAQGQQTLRARAVRDIQSLDPGYMTGGVDIEVQYATMPRLARIVTDGSTYTWAPTEYVESLDQLDDTHFSFTLKPGFAWTNDFGELTAADVKYSFERIVESDWGEKWVAFERVDVTDQYKGTIVLKHPYSAFGVSCLAAGHGCLVSHRATEAVGGRYANEIPATCGPYVIKAWSPQQRLIFARNPAWAGPRADFDEVQLNVITELASAELAFEGGELDITGIAPQAMQRYQADPPANARTMVAGYLTYGWLGMNTEHPKLQDIRVRRAIQHALDVESALAAAFSGAAEKAHGIVPPGVLGKRNESGYRYDPDRARALLQEAGVSGLQLELKTANLQERVTMAQVFQQNLADVGIDVSVTPLDRGHFMTLGREKKGDAWKDLQIYITRFGTDLDPSDAFVWFLKGQIGNWNWERWSDPEFEQLFQEAAAESDRDKRTSMYVRMQEIMEETGAYVWLQHEPEPFVHRAVIEPVIVPTGEADYRRFRLV